MTMSRPWLTLGVVPAALLGLIVLPLILYWDDLPDPMATHWDFAGEPNGSMSPMLFLLILPALYVAIHWAVTRSLVRTPYEAPSFIAGLFGLGGLLAGVSWVSVLANREKETWEAADSVGFLEIGFVLIPAVAFGYLGWYLAGGQTVERTPSGAAIPSLDIAQPGAAVWSGRGNGPLIQLIGAALIIIGLATWSWSTVVLSVLGLVVLAFAEVRVTVSHKGAVVSLGWLGIPSWTVPMSSISRAEVETVDPMAYGGWGYRLRPGARAIVTRGGEALRLVRDDETDLVLTVDDASTGAGLLNSMLGVGSS
jgi:uncharacterized membrane protein